MNTPDILAMPRAKAFAEGLLMPVAPWRRAAHGIPWPLRFSIPAWNSFVAFPGPRGGLPDARSIDVRLDRILLAVGNAFTNVGARCFADRTMNILLPLWAGPPRAMNNTLNISIITTIDEEGQDTLTILSPAEEKTLH